MLKVKFILASIAIAAIASAVLASRTKKGLRNFYSLGTTMINGVEYPGCIVHVPLPKITNPSGSLTPYLTTSTTATTFCETRVIDNL